MRRASGPFQVVKMRAVCNGDVGDWRLSDVEFVETFRLPSQAQGDRHDALVERNPLSRDERIKLR